MARRARRQPAGEAEGRAEQKKIQAGLHNYPLSRLKLILHFF
jgi:hypothetical protein